ncbi:cell division protein FtsQ/DivIB [Aquamicrobium segne]|uniref:Cell division protein FtsQ n=1 Tax=Aquamicrobium segne TaxID=469547 RepID=A0ABW0H263_9HYPH
MFSLKRKTVGGEWLSGLLPVMRAGARRWLRRPLRVASRLGAGAYVAPPFSAAILSAVLLSSSGVYGAYLGGQLEGFVQNVTARTGFAVDQIRVVGNHHTSEIDILGELELNGWTALIGLDVEDARDRIVSLPWVEHATVRKVYPNALEVRIQEREPFAIWQQGSVLSVIEKSGRIIAPFSGGRLAGLPLIVGNGASDHAPELIAQISDVPELAGRVKGYVRLGGRRWDLHLNNGVVIKLPEHDVAAALARLVRMEREQGLLGRDIVAVDLRIPDRVALELSPDASAARLAALKNAPRKPGSRI